MIRPPEDESSIVDKSTLDLQREVNEALFLSAIRQHELTEAAEKAGAALRISEERMRALFESAPMAICVCDPSGVIQNYNRLASDLWGSPPKAGVDRNLSSVQFWLPDGSLLPHDQSPVAEVLRMGAPVLNTELAIERPDGSRLPILANFGPLKDEQGVVTGAIISFVDLTDRKANEEALVRSEARFRLMAETMPQKIYTTDAQGHLTYMNPQWAGFSGVAYEELTTNGFSQILHPDDLEETLGIWRHSIESGQQFLLEHRLRRADGQYRWHISRALPMRVEGTLISLWVGSATDVHDIKEADEAMRALLEDEVSMRTAELLASNEQLQGFTYSVAHDLRQHIRGINSNASILLTDAIHILNVEDRQTLDRLLTSSRGLAALVEDLLAYARLGRQEPQKTTFDFSEMAWEVAAFLFERGECSPATTFVIQPGLMARGDLLLIRIVLENLIGNACKYSSLTEHPVIEIGHGAHGFFVRDNGVGFDMLFQHKLFQPFERLQADLPYPGTGIGLANVRRIVEKHGGKVSAEGEPGKGATFYFSLE